jgi:membrane-bound lytic murein transglycosylase B
MQFLPSTWSEYGAGGDIWSDRDAIAAASRFLHNNGAPADLSGAVFHYNPSSHYVRAVLAYSSVMAANERAYHAFYGWKVYVGTTAGEFLLPEGYVNN